MNMVFCRGCGKEIHETAVSCPFCGAVQRGPSSLQPEASNSVTEKRLLPATIICFFLGWAGVHRFYVGKVGTGLLMFLLTLCFGIGMVWWFIDFIMLICGAFTDKDGNKITQWT